VRLKRRIATSNGSFSLTRIPGIADFLGCLVGRKIANINHALRYGKGGARQKRAVQG
jgi:hypothetical protein